MKRHLERTIQGQILTFEEYYTVLTGIEACLNSRPLTPLSSSPTDLIPLTPSHCLIGDILIQPCEPDLTNSPKTLKSRWLNIQRIRQHFWKRWHRDYLNQQQTRSKWNENYRNIKVGTMVLMIEDNQPPLQWPVGRIVENYAGQDSVVRVILVKTVNGLYKRSVKKVCVLPNMDN
ncbi:uncharacterized protein LOC123010131 [Tribolium madens]|uniref:uncharacterized protein LOC123010131 n=1 Tax=Tribolium madens TaxID=41895 RepID=UPI001CF74D50|nr:uncharacterized protein LOC123010131 [Tribolium madens]